VAGPEVDLPYPRIGLHLRDRALGQHLPGVQHRDRCGERAHEVHVVLDDDNGVVGGDALQQPTRLVLLLRAHARDRLVEHQQLGVRRSFEHRGGLEGAADAEARDPVHLPADQLTIGNGRVARSG
jgi:hypothetical protein